MNNFRVILFVLSPVIGPKKGQLAIPGINNKLASLEMNNP